MNIHIYLMLTKHLKNSLLIVSKIANTSNLGKRSLDETAQLGNTLYCNIQWYRLTKLLKKC